MKRFFCFLTALFMVFSCAATAMASCETHAWSTWDIDRVVTTYTNDAYSFCCQDTIYYTRHCMVCYDEQTKISVIEYPHNVVEGVKNGYRCTYCTRCNVIFTISLR